MRFALLLILSIALTGGGMSALAQTSTSRVLARPPENCAVRKIGGHTFAEGEVYLSSHADTALLKEYGFRTFEFQGWSLGRARYEAVWPTSVPLDALPSQLDELTYHTTEQEETPDLDLPVGGNYSYAQAMSAPQDWKDVDLSPATRQRTQKSPKPAKEATHFYDPRDPAGSRPTMRLRERYDDREFTGYYRLQPANNYRFHAVDDVVSCNPQTTGTFFSTSQSHTTLTPTPIQQMYGGRSPINLYGGYGGCGSRQYRSEPRDNRRESYPYFHPQGVSLSEYSRQHGSRRR
ncbi:MAG TPA: hypothetical protein VGL38_07135 [bacterium]|jgi:hypothetical protein